MTIALGIPHCPWILDRQKSFKRLVDALTMTPRDVVDHKVFTDKEPNWSWSAKLWQWGIDTGADHLLQLQDDVIVNASFWPDLRETLSEVPDQIIGLESVHPISRQLYETGKNWYTTSDGLIGVGYVLPRAVNIEFASWRTDRMRSGWHGQVSEDTLIDLFCISTKRRVWHPVPTIIDHDVDMKSTYGNDWHTHRRPIITTVRDAKGRGWCRDGEPMHVGRFYEGSPRMCRRWVKQFHLTDMNAAMMDRGGK